jgi:hypothetical protein
LKRKIKAKESKQKEERKVGMVFAKGALRCKSFQAFMVPGMLACFDVSFASFSVWEPSNIFFSEGESAQLTHAHIFLSLLAKKKFA